MGLIKLLTTFAFIFLFTIALIGFVTQFETDNNSNVTISNDYSTLDTRLRGNLSSFRTTANSSQAGFLESEIEGGTDNIKTGGFFKILLSSGEFVGATKAILEIAFLNIFGNDVAFGIILTVIMILMTITFFAYLWKTWKGGNPD